MVHPGAEHLPEVLVAPLVDQVQVDLAQGGQEPVGVVDDDLPLAVVDRHPVAGHVPVRRHHAGPDAAVLVLEPVVDVADAHRDRGGQRLQHPHRDHPVVLVGAEDGVRVAVLAAHELVELAAVDGVGRGWGHHVPILATPASGMSTQEGRLRVS